MTAITDLDAALQRDETRASDVVTFYIPESNTYRVLHRPTGVSVEIAASKVADAVDPSRAQRTFGGGINYASPLACYTAENLAAGYLATMKHRLPASTSPSLSSER